MTDAKFRLEEIKTSMIYEVSNTPDIRTKYMRFSIRPSKLIVHLTDDSVTIVVINGQSVRRDGTLGAQHTACYSWLEKRDGDLIEWIDTFLSTERLEWA